MRGAGDRGRGVVEQLPASLPEHDAKRAPGADQRGCDVSPTAIRSHRAEMVPGSEDWVEVDEEERRISSLIWSCGTGLLIILARTRRLTFMLIGPSNVGEPFADGRYQRGRLCSVSVPSLNCRQPVRSVKFTVAGRTLCVANVGGDICVLDGVCPHEGGPVG